MDELQKQLKDNKNRINSLMEENKKLKKKHQDVSTDIAQNSTEIGFQIDKIRKIKWKRFFSKRKEYKKLDNIIQKLQTNILFDKEELKNIDSALKYNNFQINEMAKTNVLIAEQQKEIENMNLILKNLNIVENKPNRK